MPQGVETVLEDGFAIIDFVNPARRGPGLARLLEVGGPGTIDVITREGPRRKYRVPEGNAREAGFIDDPAQLPPPAPPVPVEATMGMVAPMEQWTRAELEVHARRLGLTGMHNLPNKRAVLDAIRGKAVTRGDTIPSMEVPAGSDRFT